MKKRMLGLWPLLALFAACSGGEPVVQANLPEMVNASGQARLLEQPGEFLLDGKLTVADTVMYAPAANLHVMKYPVSQRDYSQCVAAGGCKQADPVGQGQAQDMPVAGVSWQDGQDYAAWLSERTGKRFRLPTFLEWSYVAGRNAPEPAQQTLDENAQAALWLEEYLENYRRKQEQEVPLTAFGRGQPNEQGLHDIGGQVSEWTDTCHVRVHRIRLPAAESRLENCGVRTLGGEHVAVMPDFIRDPKTGACSVGVPPRYLGLRLVMEG